MNENNYKITKFAIKQNNLELLNNVLKEEDLSEEQLSECLVLAKDKTDIYQVLSKLIMDSSEESKESEESESETKICIDSFNNIYAKDNSKLMLAFHFFLNRGGAQVKEELWTTEQVDKVNSEGWSVIHYMINSTIYVPHMLEKALKLSNSLEKTLTYHFKIVVIKNCFPKFKIIWKVAKEKNLTELIEKECILKYIHEKKIRNYPEFIKYLLEDEDYDVQYEDQNFIDVIVKRSLNLDSGYTMKMAEKLLKQPNYKPNYLNFLEANWWTNCNTINRKILLKSNKFFLDKDELQNLVVSGDTNFVCDFLKYCPQNIQLSEKKETFDSWDDLIEEYFEYKVCIDKTFYQWVNLKKDLGEFKKGHSFKSLAICWRSNTIKLIGLDKEATFRIFEMRSQISFK